MQKIISQNSTPIHDKNKKKNMNREELPQLQK